jgi:hypothetical protein
MDKAFTFFIDNGSANRKVSLRVTGPETNHKKFPGCRNTVQRRVCLQAARNTDFLPRIAAVWVQVHIQLTQRDQPAPWSHLKGTGTGQNHCAYAEKKHVFA